MYESFGVKNFRCFKDLQINDLGRRINLIAGKNNTGKTALMEAMYFAAGNRNAETLLRARTANARNTSSIVTWNTIFHNFDTSEPIEMTAKIAHFQASLFDLEAAHILRLTTLEDPHDYEELWNHAINRGLSIESGLDYLKIDSGRSHEQSKYLRSTDRTIDRLFGKEEKLLPTRFLHTSRRISVTSNSRSFSRIRQSIGIDMLVSSLKMIEPRLRDLEILVDRDRPLIHADIGLGQLVALSSFGDGMNRFMSMLLTMSEVPRGAIFIDEIENGIHHSVQCKVWQAIGKLARELDIQVFATTHSLEMIRAAYEAFSEDGKLDEFRYHRLSRSRKSGELRATTYNELDMEAVAAFDFDHEVR